MKRVSMHFVPRVPEVYWVCEAVHQCCVTICVSTTVVERRPWKLTSVSLTQRVRPHTHPEEERLHRRWNNVHLCRLVSVQITAKPL